MRCPNCGSALSLKNNHCSRCMEDVRVYKKVVKASNAFYNQGLMKAKVRDLSGAVVALNTSLELDKTNTNARNLLGLVYYEMGETVSALSSWVLSKHFQPEDNDADEYMSEVQENPTRLDSMNQAIKKYNSALLSAKQGNTDLAIIQLKKVVTLNVKFIRAYQLLALLYINQGEKEKARKLLIKANAIDVNNTTTLCYLKEVGVQSTNRPSAEAIKEREQKEEHKKQIMNPEKAVFTALGGSFKEDKPSIWLYLNLLIGVVLGICIFYFLIGPQMNTTTEKELRTQISEKTKKISSLESDKVTLSGENERLKAQVETLEASVKDLEGQVIKENDKEDGSSNPYDSLLSAANLLLDKKNEEAALAIVSVDPKNYTIDSAKNLYEYVKEKTFKNASKSTYSDGYKKYQGRKYDDAITLLTQSYQLNNENQDAIYFLARSYHQKKDLEKAKEYYTILTEKYPDSKRGKEAKTKLNQIK